MKKVLSLLSVAALAANASAQSVLTEDFSYSTTAMFPPAGWSATTVTAPYEWLDAGTASPAFQVLISDAAAHDWSNPGTICDSWLFSPTMDLSGLSNPTLTFDSDVYYVAFMSHYAAGPLGTGTSNVEVTSDGGATWTNVWTETAQADGFYPGQTADLTAFSGQSAVEFAFVYGGDNGHDWGVDNVVVDNGGVPVGPSLALSCVGGLVTADFSNFTPGGPIAIVYGSPVPYVHGGNQCNGVALDLTPNGAPIVIPADGAGAAQYIRNVNPAACGGGILVQAVDGATCTASNAPAL